MIMQKLQQKHVSSAGPSKLHHTRRLGDFSLSGGHRRKEGKGVSAAVSLSACLFSLSAGPPLE